MPPWHCAFTEDAILDDCDAFWSKIARIMAWFLIVTHNRVKGTWSEICDTTLELPPSVTLQIHPINPNLSIRETLSVHKRSNLGIFMDPRARTYVQPEYVYSPPSSHVEQQSSAGYR